MVYLLYYVLFCQKYLQKSFIIYMVSLEAKGSKCIVIRLVVKPLCLSINMIVIIRLSCLCELLYNYTDYNYTISISQPLPKSLIWAILVTWIYWYWYFILILVVSVTNTVDYCYDTVWRSKRYQYIQVNIISRTNLDYWCWLGDWNTGKIVVSIIEYLAMRDYCNKSLL